MQVSLISYVLIRYVTAKFCYLMTDWLDGVHLNSDLFEERIMFQTFF